MEETDKQECVAEPDVSFEYINPRYTLSINDDDEHNQILQPISGYAQEPLLSLEEACEPLKTIIPRLETYVWVAKQNSKSPTDDLTQDESAAIRLYTMEWDSADPDARDSLYAHLNRTLKQIDRTKLRPWFRYLKLLLTALAKLPCAPRQTVWRGVRKDYSKDYIPGTESTWWAFSSCTTSLSVLESDLYLGQVGTRTLFSIEAINGRTVRTHSHFKSEDEILLLPGTYFEVKSRLNPAPDLFIVHLAQKSPPHDLLEPPYEGAQLMPVSYKRTDKRTRFALSQHSPTDEENRSWYKQNKPCLGFAFFITTAILLTVILAAVLTSQMRKPIIIAATSTTSVSTIVSRSAFIPDPPSKADAFYAFDDDTLDLYSRRNGRFIGGNATYVPGYVAYGKAIAFHQNTPSYINVKRRFDITQQTSFTVEGFFWLTKTLLNCTLVRLSPVITMNISEGKLKFYLGSEAIIPSNATLSTDQWHHFAFIYDAIEQRGTIFIDGNLDATDHSVTPDVSSDVNNSSVIIGANFQGYIDQLSIILRAKTSAEIQWDATTVAYYPLEYRNVLDKGPNGINGTGSSVLSTNGWLNTGLKFNSSTAYYQTGELTALGTPRQAFSIALWVRAEARAGVFLTVTNRYTCLLVLGLQNETNKLIAFIPNDARPAKAINIVGPQMPIYNWVHVAFTWSYEDGAILYTSGYMQGRDKEATTLNNEYNVNNSLPMTITLGHYDGTANCEGIAGINASDQFMGSLDELYVFSREVSKKEIDEILAIPPKNPSG